MWAVSAGNPGRGAIHPQAQFFQETVRQGDGMVSNPSEEERNDIFLQLSPLSALANTEPFCLADGVSSAGEREPARGTFCARRQPSQGLCAGLQPPDCGVSHVQACRKREPQTECAITTFEKEAKILLPAPFSHIHPSSEMISLPLVYLHLSVWSVRGGCRPTPAGGGGQSSLPVGGDNLRCWYIAPVF